MFTPKFGQNEVVSLNSSKGPIFPAAETLVQSRVSILRLRELLFWAVSFPVVLTLIVLSVLFVLSRDGISDPDIWWHLHNADYLVHQHALPRSDMYSFTVHGHAWINHEWLAELPYYFACRLWGISGVQAVMFAFLALIFLELLYLCYRESRHYKASIIAVSFAVFLSSVSFGPRTILPGYAYMVLLLILLQRLRQVGDAPLWLLPPLFCLWINTHGSWLLGMVLFCTVIAAGFVDGEWGFITAQRWTKRQRNKLLWCWGASVLALFVNPFGYRLVVYPFDLAFRQRLNVEHVAEWVSVNFHDLRGRIVLALLIILLVTALLRPRRWRLAELAMVLFALFSGLTYIRFLFLLAIVVAPILAKTFDFVPRYRREMDTPLVNAFVMLLIVTAVAHYWPRQSKLESLIAEQYPVRAASYLESHPTDGPMLNFYLWGGYVNWRDPHVKVFIDSRVDIFEYAGVLRDFLDLLALKQPDTLMQKYHIRYVLFPPAEPLTYALQHDPQWQTVYSDNVSVLLERKASGGKESGNDDVANASMMPDATGDRGDGKHAIERH